MQIRDLFPAETPVIAEFYRDAPEYWLLSEDVVEPDRQAAEFFTDAPPKSDPAKSHRLGLFLEGRLSGVAEVSYGFPDPEDSYLGLMLLGPWAQGCGHGRAFLAHAETLARNRGAPRLYLAVLDANPRGRAFWLREGFLPTGLRGQNTGTGHWLERLVKVL